MPVAEERNLKAEVNMPVLKLLAKAIRIAKTMCKTFVPLVYVHTYTACAACWAWALPWAATTTFQWQRHAAVLAWHHRQMDKNLMDCMAFMWGLTHTQLTQSTVCFLHLALLMDPQWHCYYKQVNTDKYLSFLNFSSSPHSRVLLPHQAPMSFCLFLSRQERVKLDSLKDRLEWAHTQYFRGNNKKKKLFSSHKIRFLVKYVSSTVITAYCFSWLSYCL